MPQSLVKNAIHLVFSTKHRQPLIDEFIEAELYAYLGSVLSDLDCIPVKIGGYTDHVHLLFLLTQKIPLMDVVEKVKGNSSKWIKTRGEAYENFYWQRGYGAFSVNPSEMHVVIRYITNQKEHHRNQMYQDEFRAFLKKYEVEYDERYVWD